MNDNSIIASQSLQRLKDGNKRFVEGVISINTLATQLNRQVLASQGQNPHTIVLTCSDSRVPAEMIFDCGLGELFVLRIAGNIFSPMLLGSIEFAAINFNTSLCLVMGHSSCGAISLAISHALKPRQTSTPNINSLIGAINPSVTSVEAKGQKLDNERSNNMVGRENVLNTVRNIQTQSTLISRLIAERNFKLCGAYYDINSGCVDFFD